MRDFPGDAFLNRVNYEDEYFVKNGVGTITGCGHGYGFDSGSGYGRGMTNYPHQLIQYWK